MQRSSPPSPPNPAGEAGRKDLSLTPRHGSTLSDGQTSQKVREWLLSKTPAEVDEATRRSLTSSLGVTVNEVWEGRYPEEGRPWKELVSVGLTGLSTENLSQAIAKVEAAMTPPSRSDCDRMIAQLQAVKARRNASADTAEMALDIYSHVLLQHPADVAREAVQSFVMAPGNPWMPDPGELDQKCRAMGASRRYLLQRLKTWKPPVEEGAKKPDSPEDRAKVEEMMAEIRQALKGGR